MSAVQCCVVWCGAGHALRYAMLTLYDGEIDVRVGFRLGVWSMDGVGLGACGEGRGSG